ncbi:MAG: beta-hydroxyacyl-ACP dehydratase [Gemmatimonadetes bacterium]|jgi:3-hydroxyacyl-[acyl-carrier-protein] dehydratase|nr:beta-hydroxyacyl-ACP dehydratase [Gemmatimonadota bacterium]|tara:strand:- start:7982 stop:8431 length:450 start_codon:yes stop_codon:yes gene_type:complete
MLSGKEILTLLPQQEPFRFVDNILEVDEDHIIANYRFRPEADFYKGHFPGNPVTPGVILLESLAQVGVVALGIYLFALEEGLRGVTDKIALFVDADVEFSGIVLPGEKVIISGKKVFFRRNKLRTEAMMTTEDGSLVCSGTISGLRVQQ